METGLKHEISAFKYDACVIGTGRVGLPLALSLIGAGYNVVGLDRDEKLRTLINSGVMPFHENGFEELIASRRLHVEAASDVVAQSRAVIITVGTPLHAHIETDLSQINSVLQAITPQLRKGQLICLRSTVAPNTTRYVSRWVEGHTDLRIGTDIGLAMCPERLAEGKAREEIGSLPQIIGVEDSYSRALVQALFARLGCELLYTDYVSAELVKLFNNAARYIQFAVSNQFAIICDSLGVEIHKVRELANYKYPRSHIASPGFTAGTCLRKDFGMINEWSPYPDLLLSAWKVNEFMPAFLVQHMLRHIALHGQNVAILGYSFKADTDDVRDSLAPKLLRYIQRELPEVVRISDHCLPDPLPGDGGENLRNWPEEEALDGVNCVFIATNHSGYRELLLSLARKSPQVWIADIWNVGGLNKIFYVSKELLDAAGPQKAVALG